MINGSEIGSEISLKRCIDILITDCCDITADH